jgi:hypothetical protein
MTAGSTLATSRSMHLHSWIFIWLFTAGYFFLLECITCVESFGGSVVIHTTRHKTRWKQRSSSRVSVAIDSTATTDQATVNDVDTTVQVWDDVISEEIQTSLHDAACQIGLGHRVFSRRHIGPTNNIEVVIDRLLSEMHDNSNYVEYWTRQEWRSIEAHADVDECLAKRQQQQQQQQETTQPDPNSSFRYPQHGHVLYLRVGRKVRGPTCVFPGRRSGGDLLRNMSFGENGGTGGIEESPSSPSDSAVELLTVPAVPGRLLRFQGDYLHAVPRPTDLWLLKFVQGAPQFEPESEWGRSVVLFNTWNDEPPAEVPVSQIVNQQDVIPSDISMSCRDRNDWVQGFQRSSTSVFAGDDIDLSDEERLSAKIWLLGDYKRRDHRMQTLKLEAPESLREALNRTSAVSRIWLRQSV